MSISGIYKSAKARGLKLNIFKIPVSPHPITIEHNIKKEFDRERTHSLLEEIVQFLDDLELNPELLDTSRLRNLRGKICALRRELHEYKC